MAGLLKRTKENTSKIRECLLAVNKKGCIYWLGKQNSKVTIYLTLQSSMILRWINTEKPFGFLSNRIVLLSFFLIWLIFTPHVVIFYWLLLCLARRTRRTVKPCMTNLNKWIKSIQGLLMRKVPTDYINMRSVYWVPRKTKPCNERSLSSEDGKRNTD